MVSTQWGSWSSLASQEQLDSQLGSPRADTEWSEGYKRLILDQTWGRKRECIHLFQLL